MKKQKIFLHACNVKKHARRDLARQCLESWLQQQAIYQKIENEYEKVLNKYHTAISIRDGGFYVNSLPDVPRPPDPPEIRDVDLTKFGTKEEFLKSFTMRAEKYLKKLQSYDERMKWKEIEKKRCEMLAAWKAIPLKKRMFTHKNRYGNWSGGAAMYILQSALGEKVDVEEAFSPGCWGLTPRINIINRTIQVPGGTYQSNKHFHTAGWWVEDADETRRLVLLVAYGYNGDYKSLSKAKYLIGKNPDGTLFAVRVPPKIDSVEAAQNWVFGKKNIKFVKEV